MRKYSRQYDIAAVLVSLWLILALVGCGPDNTSIPKPSPTPEANERKVDSNLLDILLQYRLNGAEAAKTFAREKGVLDTKDNVLFTLVLDDEKNVATVSDKIQQMGGTVRGVYKNLVAGSVPLDILVGYVTQDDQRANFFAELSNFKSVREIRLNPPPAS